VIADAGHVRVAHPYARGALLDDDQLVRPVELGVGAHDVAVHEAGRAERSQGVLQAHRDGQVERGGADVLGDVGVLEHLLGRAPQRELGLVGEPVVLVAQILLGLRQARQREHALDRLPAGFALDVGEDQA